MTMLPPADDGLDRSVAKVASLGSRMAGVRFESATTSDNKARRFQKYARLGFELDEAASLASRGDLPESYVLNVARERRIVDLARSIGSLQDPDAQRSRWERLNAEDQAALRERGVNFDAPTVKQSGLFGVPYLGDFARGALNAGTAVAEGINDLTAGSAGYALGKAFDGFQWASDKVSLTYRNAEWNVREQGWVRGVFRPIARLNAPRSGEDDFRPGTRERLLEQADGDEALVGLALKVARGWDDDQIIRDMGFDETENPEAYATELASMQAMRQDPTLKTLAATAERNKMSPGRALANALGLDSTGYTAVSGITDGVFTMFVDPTLIASKPFKVARLSRFTKISGTGTDAIGEINNVLQPGVLVEARRLRSADDIINPLDHGRYFERFRQVSKQLNLSAEQQELLLFTDHVLAGTRAGSPDLADDGVAAVLGQYQKLRPEHSVLTNNVLRLIGDGEITDEWTLLTRLRDGVLLDGMRAGVGRRAVMDRVEGMFVPRMSLAGTYRLQAELRINQAIDWAGQTRFGVKTVADGDTARLRDVLSPRPQLTDADEVVKLPNRLRARDLAKADVWLNETMRRNRAQGQHLLDDYVDFTRAMRDEGFDDETIRAVIPRSVTEQLGGIVIEGETPIFTLARLAVREGRVAPHEITAIEDVLRGLFPDSPEEGEGLVRAFRTTTERWFHAFRDEYPTSYAETILDDAAVDDQVRALLNDLYTVAEASNLDEERFWTEAFKGGLWQRSGDVDVDGALDDLRQAWATRTFELRTPQGQTTVVSAPDEYRELIADIVHNHVLARAEEMEDGLRILDAKIGVVPSLLRMVGRPVRNLVRQMPRHDYIEFGTPGGYNEMRRWLDLGVIGDDANRLLGDFMKASTDAQRRAVLFAAQREMLRATGILYDPAHADWVRSVLGNTQQALGTAMLDNTGTLRPMALYPQSQKADAMRLVNGRELMAHFQRTRFMATFSPRFGTFLAKDGATYVQRVNRYWKPLAVMSPRLILRAGLDENLTLLATEGFSGNNGLVARYAREWALRMHQRKFTQGRRLAELTPGDLDAAFRRNFGPLGRLPSEVDADLAALRALIDGPESLELNAVKRRLQRDSRELIEQGILDQGTRLWELPPTELKRALDDAELAGLFDSVTPVLSRPAAHITQSATWIERRVDGLLERMGRWLELDDRHLQAAMSLAQDPTVRRELTQNITHSGVWWDVRQELDPEDALRGDLEEFGVIELIQDKASGFTLADVHDELGRHALAHTFQMAGADEFGRMDAAVRSLEMGHDQRIVLQASLDEELPFLVPAPSTVGDPFDDAVVDGALAPLVERAHRDGDRILMARGAFITFPQELKDRIWAELDGSIRYQANAELRALTAETALGPYRENLARLGITEASPLWLSDEDFATYVDWFLNHGLHTDKRWQLAVDDTWIRPGAASDRAMAQRIGGPDVVYARSFTEYDRDPALLTMNGPQEGGIGPGVVITPHTAVRGQPNLHVPTDAQPLRLAADDGVPRYVLSLNDMASVPPSIADALARGLDGMLADLDELASPAFMDGGQITQAQVDMIKAAFAFDPADPDSLRDFVHNLSSRVEMLYDAYDDEIPFLVQNAVTAHFYNVLIDRGVVGFVNAPNRSLRDDVIVPLADLVAGGADPADTVTLFDARALTPIQARADKGLSAEMLVRDRYDDQVDDYLDLLQGAPAESTRLGTDRKVEFLTRTSYWRHYRGHDSVGPLNDVPTAPGADEVILHVPVRRGQPIDPTVSALGAVDPDLARRQLELAAGTRVDDWDLLEVVVKRSDLARRRPAPATGEMGVAGVGLADVPPDAARAGDQLYEVSGQELAATPVRPDLDEEVVLLPDRALIEQDLSDRWARAIDEDPADGEVNLNAFLLSRDPDVFTDMALSDQWRLAAEALLLDVLDEVGVGLDARLLNDVSGRLMRVHGKRVARQHGLPEAMVDVLAEQMAATGWRPDWLRFDPTKKLSAQVRRGKRLDTAARQFAKQFDADARGLLHDSHKGEPIWDLLGPVHRGTFRADMVRRYHGALPARAIRPKMKPPDTRGRFGKFTDPMFEWIGNGIAELARWPMFFDTYADALRTAKAGRVATPQHLAREARFRTVFGDRFEELMLRFENDFAEVLDASDRVQLLTDIDDDLVRRFTSFYGDLPDGQLAEFKRYLGAEMEHRHLERRLAMQSAVGQVAPYVDDHRIRSMFADSVDEVIPFFYATEHFVRRWARTAWHSPEAFRRLELYYHGLHASGAVFQDPNTGEDVFEIPLSGFLLETIADIFGTEEVPGVNFLGRTKDVLPGLQDGMRFGAGPVLMGPVAALRRFAPQELTSFERFLGGDRAEGRSLWDIWLPSAITRFGPAAQSEGSPTDAIAVMAYLEANHPDLVPRTRFDEITGEPILPTAEEIAAYQDSVRHGTRIMHLVKGMFGLVSPASPRIELDVDGLNAEFVELLDAGMPIDQAVGVFLDAHPHATAYTIFATTTPSGAPTQPTQAVWDALDENGPFYEGYRMAAPWLLPFDEEDADDFHRAAWAQMVAMGFKERKSPDEWYTDLKFAEGAHLYFPNKQAKDAALDAAPTPEHRERIRQSWRDWMAEFQAIHPVFMRELMSQEGASRREEVRRELRLALADPLLPVVPQAERIGTLLDGWDRLSLILGDHLSYSPDERRAAQESFDAWAREVVKEDSMASAFYYRNLQRELDLPVLDEEV